MDCERDDHLKESIKNIAVLDGDFMQQMALQNLRKINIVSRYALNKIQPDAVYNVHMQFLKAGANIIRTNTAQAFIPLLMRTLNIDKNDSIYLIQRGVEIARKAVDDFNLKSNVRWDKAKVVGTCGRFPHIRGTSYNVKKVYRKHMQILLNAGVDALSLENIQKPKEMKMFIDLLQEFPNAHALMMCTKRSKQRSYYLQFIPKSGMRFYNPRLMLAYGVNDIPREKAKFFFDNLTKNKKERDQIRLVVCTSKKFGEEKWKPVNVETDTPAIEWAKIGIHYIGGGRGVDAEDIKSIRQKLEEYTV